MSRRSTQILLRRQNSGSNLPPGVRSGEKRQSPAFDHRPIVRAFLLGPSKARHQTALEKPDENVPRARPKDA